MALKDNWVDKVDGEDIVQAADINEIANAVIELEGALGRDTIIWQINQDYSAVALGDVVTTTDSSLTTISGKTPNVNDYVIDNAGNILRIHYVTAGGGLVLEMVSLAKSGESEWEKPATIGQMACLARVKQMRDIKYTPLKTLPHHNGDWAANVEQTGLPYSSVRLTDRFIGFNVSIHTFMTAIQNPKSILYTDTEVSGNSKCCYGTNCSTFLAYVLDWDYHTASNILPELPYVEEIEPSNMRLCDFPEASTSHGSNEGHATIITGIKRDSNGTPIYLEISESDGDRCTKKEMTYSEWYTDYITNRRYKLYRYKYLDDVRYFPINYVRQFVTDNFERVVYSDICTNLGDKATIRTDETITINPINTDGYTAIKVYKDGELFGSYGVTDITLSNLEAGKYTAKLYPEAENAETSFIVNTATVEKSGIRYTFSGDGKPLRIVFKNTLGFTLDIVELTKQDIINGYKDIEYANVSCTEVCVPFKNDYGFVVAKCDFKTQESADIPDTYQQVKYIATNGGNYIDTGVIASNYNDGIHYVMKGNATGIADSSKSCYYFGALADGVRTGNVSILKATESGYDAGLTLLCGADGSAKRQGAFHYGKDFEIEVIASSKLEDTTMTLNGNAVSRQGYVTVADMPNASIYLLACNGIDVARSYVGKLYSFKMNDVASGNAIRNFVPCYRKSDNVIGLYDTVTGTFFTNSGTGAFTKGADV